MKKRARLISVFLAALLIFATVATGVFANDDVVAEEQTQEVALETPDNSDVDAAPQEGQPEADVQGDEAESSDVETQDISMSVTFEGTTATVSVPSGVEFVTALKESTEVKTEAVSGSKATISGLEYNTTYTFQGLDSTRTAIAGKSVEGTTPAAPVPGTPTIAAYPGYKSVTVMWAPTTDAASYELVRTDVGVIYAGPATSFRDTAISGDTEYAYYVVAVAADGTTKSAQSNVATGSKVRTCYYRITFKKNVKLESHDGTKTKHTFKKGQTVYADGYSQGKYQFDFEGHRYHAKWMRIKNPKGLISRNAYDNGVTPTNYVNESGYSSPTGYLVWVNIYSQRVYVFQGSAGNWTMIQNWQCGTGKAKTPTPTGMNKKLHKKYKKYSRHKYWNCFSGTNAIHGSNGTKEVKKLGKLISNGCVRVTNDQALWMLNTVPKNTRFLVY